MPGMHSGIIGRREGGQFGGVAPWKWHVGCLGCAGTLAGNEMGRNGWRV